MNWACHSPPDIGGVDATSRRSREASFNGADGAVGNGTLTKERIPKHFGNPDHPSCIRRGIPSLTLIHTFMDRAYSRLAITWTRSLERRTRRVHRNSTRCDK